MLAHDRDFTRIEAKDEIAVGDRLELVERVEQRKRIERLLIKGIVLEGPFEGSARTGLVAGAEEMPAKICVGADVRFIDGQSATDQCRGFIEAIVARGVIAGHAIHLAVDRVDFQNLLDPGVERGRLPFEEVDRRFERVRFEAVGIHFQRALDAISRLIPLPVVERHLGGQEVCGHGAGVHLERPLDCRLRGGWILFGGDARDAEDGGHVRLVRLERVLEGPHRLLAVVLLEKQLAPRRVHGDVGGCQSIGLTEEPIGVLKRPERASGLTETQEIGRGLRVDSGHNQTQDAHALAAAAQLHVQQSKLEGRVTAWLSRGHRRQEFLGFGVATARDLGARANRDRPCVCGGPQHTVDLVGTDRR